MIKYLIILSLLFIGCGDCFGQKDCPALPQPVKPYKHVWTFHILFDDYKQDYVAGYNWREEDYDKLSEYIHKNRYGYFVYTNDIRFAYHSKDTCELKRSLILAELNRQNLLK